MNRFAIFGVPRSGTSWLSQICNSHPDVMMRFQPLFSYTHTGRLKDASSAVEIDMFFEEIIRTSDPFTLMNSASHRNYPKFQKSLVPTHLGFKETRYLNIIENLLQYGGNTKILGIVRNPLAVLASWQGAPKEFNPEWDIRLEWRYASAKNMNKTEEFYGFEKWKSSTRDFLRFQKEYPDRFRLIRYDKLRMRPAELTGEIFKFLDLGMDEQVTHFIEASQATHDNDPYSVFRGKANDNSWRNSLPAEIVDEILVELRGSGLDQFIGDTVNA